MNSPKAIRSLSKLPPYRGKDSYLKRFTFIVNSAGEYDGKYSYAELPAKFLSQDKVKVVCPTHGVFTPQANNHTAGRSGCPTCATESASAKRRWTTEEFVEQAIKVHGRKYDYSRVVYSGSTEPVAIVCSIHGVYMQRPSDHINLKAGCPKCGAKRRAIPVEQFWQRVREAQKFEKNDYSDSLFLGMEMPITARCKLHDITFTQKATNHAAGQEGCEECRREAQRKGIAQWKTEAEERFKDRFSYGHLAVYRTRHDNISLVCPDHGEFTTTFSQHLNTLYGGCQKCANAASTEIQTKTIEEFIVSAIAVHGDDYSYADAKYMGSHIPVQLYCNTCGTGFHQLPHGHLAGRGCRVCALTATAAKKRITTKKLRSLGRTKFPHVDYTAAECESSSDTVTLRCKIHNRTYTQKVADHTVSVKGGCPSCAAIDSAAEVELFRYIEALMKGVEVQHGNRTAILGEKGRYLELDIYIPEKKIAVEFNGVLYHSDKYEKQAGEAKIKHLRKTTLCAEQGIKLIHVYEDEWADRRSAVCNMLKAKLGVSQRVYARKCEVIEISSKTARTHLDEWHIQGGANCNAAFGLMYGGNVVAVMTFTRSLSERGPQISGRWELNRFASAGVVVGGMSKLLSAFIHAHNPSEVVSYSDNDVSAGDVYSAQGFELVHISKPDYKYVKGKKRFHKSGFRRSELQRKFKEFDPELSEWENCKRLGYYRIWDTGKKKWLLKVK